MDSKSFRYFISICVICVIINKLVPVKCQKVSKLEIIKFLFDMKGHLNIIQKIREKPLLQLIGLVHDIVEPIVTFAEIILLIEEKLKKLEGKDPQKDNVLVFSGKNKIEINHIKKPHHMEPPYHLPPNLHLPAIKHSKEYDNLIPLESNHKLIEGDAVGDMPELLSVSANHKHGFPGENTFKLNFKSHSPQQNFHLSRDLPPNFVLLFGKNYKKGSFHVLNNPHSPHNAHNPHPVNPHFIKHAAHHPKQKML